MDKSKNFKGGTEAQQFVLSMVHISNYLSNISLYNVQYTTLKSQKRMLRTINCFLSVEKGEKVCFKNQNKIKCAFFKTKTGQFRHEA